MAHLTRVVVFSAIVASAWILLALVLPPAPPCLCPVREERAVIAATEPPKERPWDGLAPIYPPPPWDVDCDAFWVAIPPAMVGPSFVPFRMCIRPEPDVMGNSIRTDGRWKDCDELLPVWRGANASGLFVDIGANIGTCTLLMLAEGARVVAFEPLPANLHYLTRSLFLQPESQWRARLSLYPLGVGRSASEHTAFSQSDNAGNTVLDVPVHAAQNHDRPVTVRVARLDDVLWPDAREPPPLVSLAKIDIQGYEMEALGGARRLLEARAIRAIHTEVSVEHLRAQNTSGRAYCAFLRDAGFSLERVGTAPGPVDEETCARWDLLPNQFSADIVARLNQGPPGPWI